ncbi:hypothetical protein Tco_0660896 [Tanacetum coccineum]
MTTLAEFMIIAGADKRHPMLEKSLHDSWKSRIEHYMDNRENGRMILNSVQNGPLIWPTITEADGITRTKKYETKDLDAYHSNYDDVSNAKAVLMDNLSSYGSDVLSEVAHSDSYHNDMDNQSVHAMQDFEQIPIVDFLDNEITSDSNIILYSQYLQET